MYPRNAASPEPIAIGAVVQISDGAVQTSGCTVRIKPIGVSEGDGAGTTAYSTDGIVEYTPTQAETNYTSFILIAKKTGCIPVAITVVTSESATPGRVSVGNIIGTALTETSAGYLAAGFKKLFDVAAPVLTAASVNQTGDSFAKFAGMTNLAQWLGALMGKQAANSTAQTEIRATGAGSGTFDATTDSTEAVRDRGDSAWTTAAGFATSSALSALTGTIATLDALLLKVRKYFMLALRKDAAIATDAATEKTELNANLGAGAGGFDQTTDSIEAIRDRGDAAWITGTAPLDAAGTRTALGLASANLDTQLGDIPTNAELATALGTADDAVLSAIAALNNLSSAGAAAAAAAALATYGAALEATAQSVKTKTDQLTFGAPNAVDANVTHINEVGPLIGDGNTTPFNVP